MLLVIYCFEKGNNITTGSINSASHPMILHGRGFQQKGVISIDSQSVIRIMLVFCPYRESLINWINANWKILNEKYWTFSTINTFNDLNIEINIYKHLLSNACDFWSMKRNLQTRKAPSIFYRYISGCLHRELLTVKNIRWFELNGQPNYLRSNISNTRKSASSDI